MTVGSVQQQSAASHSGALQAAARTRRLLDLKNAESSQAVEDPANQQVTATGDQERQRKQRENPRKHAETVEIAGLDLDAQSAEPAPSAPPSNHSTLDIEA